MMSLRTHNILDYVGGALVALCSFAVADVEPARNLFLAAGLGQIAYSLLTRYQYSLVKAIPLGAHMVLDILAGVALIAGPSLFRYREALTGGQVGLHVALGAGVFALVLLTNRKTERWSHPASRMSLKAERELQTAGRR
jgi:hypothetical protein